MQYVITMNVPVRSRDKHDGTPDRPQLVHQVLAEHPAATLAEVCAKILEDGCIIVDEIYKDARTLAYYSVGETALLERYIAKIRYLYKEPGDNRRGEKA